MKIVMTLLARNEADIVDTQIGFHLAAGVDFIVATDHQSSDGTAEILERYAAQGVLHLLKETSSTLHQSAWVTRMARIATVEHDADWVINSDADEFWWPSGGDLKHALAEVPADYGIVQTFVRTFLPPLDDGGSFADRMIVRLLPAAPINDPVSPFRVNVRLIHRGAPDVTVRTGNAALVAPSLIPLRAGSPIEVFHFPIRSYAHFERKFLAHHQTVRERRRGDHLVAFDAASRGRLHDVYRRICASEEQVSSGVGNGTLVVDVRLRDALRGLRRTDPIPPTFARRDATTELGYYVEKQALEDGELVRMQRRLDELGRRVAGLRPARRGSPSPVGRRDP
jgi:Glycosyl transferase family 2